MKRLKAHNVVREGRCICEEQYDNEYAREEHAAADAVAADDEDDFALIYLVNSMKYIKTQIH